MINEKDGLPVYLPSIQASSAKGQNSLPRFPLFERGRRWQTVRKSGSGGARMMLGESLRKYRKKENLSQEQLAQRLHVSRQAIAKWERGAGLPDVENLIGLSRLTGASIDELLGLTDARAAEAPEQSTRPQNVPASAASAAPEQPVPLRDAPASTRDAVPHPSARPYAFGALGFLFAAFCWVVAGLVNLAAAWAGRTPAFLPMLNFGTAIVSLAAAYRFARICSQYRK